MTAPPTDITYEAMLGKVISDLESIPDLKTKVETLKQHQELAKRHETQLCDLKAQAVSALVDDIGLQSVAHQLGCSTTWVTKLVRRSKEIN